MQSISTLYIVQASFARIGQCLVELEHLIQPQDAVILMEDSVFALSLPVENHPMEKLQVLYVLESDAHLIPAHLSALVNIINYVDFAQMVQNAEKVITWK
ncbi:MAG: hypothetical protein LKF82_12700 [Acinetobacter populi]|jgi:sulfur relay protein TusB/DsrH|uniref:DsrH/TusB family sulfur metabolism protein n=1 Tax=Acinetobacter populi TaxID=1582270 RepID=UPI00235355C1|nr:DsrH/TusB family sulfur metabolism protein [Acinetobacter populi]MCH4248665.1 hypothetical protein [Acinetobacter populi]